MLSKDERAVQLLGVLNDLKATHGVKIPTRLPGATRPDILVEHDKRWRARFSHDCRMAYAMRTKNEAAEMLLHAPGATLLIFEGYGERRVILNDCDGAAEPYLYLPGAWEAWFDIDNVGDTVALRPELFADPREQGWRAFLASQTNSSLT